MQSNESEALYPPELQSRITELLAASPDIAEAVSLSKQEIQLSVWPKKRNQMIVLFWELGLLHKEINMFLIFIPSPFLHPHGSLTF